MTGDGTSARFDESFLENPTTGDALKGIHQRVHKRIWYQQPALFSLHYRTAAFGAPDLMPHGVSAFCQIWSTPTTCCSTFQSFALGSRRAISAATQGGQRKKAFKEELMKSLSELADVYKKNGRPAMKPMPTRFWQRRILTPTKSETISFSVRSN
jgi:hypothetical protein